MKSVFIFLVFVVTLAVFYLSPVTRITDSHYSLLLSEHLLLAGRFELDPYLWPRVDSTKYPEVRTGKQVPRNVRSVNNHYYYFYPPGSSLLSIPFVAISRFLGLSTIDADGRYNKFAEYRMQKILSPLLMATACVIFFLMARTMLTPVWSAGVALSAGLGTQIWSTASRGLWTHTWGIVLLALALYYLMRACLGLSRFRPILIATLLFLAFLVRPTAAFLILPLTVLVLVTQSRAHFSIYAATGATGGILFALLNLSLYGHILPPYYRLYTKTSLPGLGTGLAGNLVSPSRGLFVYVPLTLFVIYLVAAYWRQFNTRPLLIAVLAGTGLHLLSISSFQFWWGGNSYGPRLSTDLVPHFALMGVVGAQAALRRRRDGAAGTGSVDWRSRMEAVAFGMALVLGSVINGAGAVSMCGKGWNSGPPPIDVDPMRAFDWSQPQFLAALLPDRFDLPACQARVRKPESLAPSRELPGPGNP